MIAKTITYKELEGAIKIAFSDDPKIFEIYDPNVKVSSVEEIAENIMSKVKDHGSVQLKGVYDKNKLVGYYIRGKGMLISFGLCMEYRVRKFKNKLFDLIKQDFKGTFVCFLWSVNIRAIVWLQKQGMQVIQTDHQLTKLIYQ